MSLELINTLGTITTVVIVAAAAVAALVQLRHLRAGNQISAILSIEDEISTKSFLDAQALMTQELPAALHDPLFRKYTIARSLGKTPPEVEPAYAELRNAVELVANAYEEFAILIKHGVIDKALFLDSYCFQVLRIWEPLKQLTALNREATQHESIWENFEYLAVLSEDWMQAHPSTYPKGVRRMQLHNPWPVSPEPAATVGG